MSLYSSLLSLFFLPSPNLFLSKAISTSISFSIKLLHRFSDLYSFHKSYSSQVSIYLTLGTSYRCTKGVFTQCHSVAHNSRFSDFPQSVELFLFTFQYFVPMGHYFLPNSCAIWGNYNPIYLLLCAGQLPSHTFSMGH